MSNSLRPTLVFFLLIVSFSVTAQEIIPDITASLPDDIGEISRDAPAWLLRNWGRAARLDRNLSDAFLLLTRSLEKDPNNPETLTELALSYADSNDFHQALEHLEQALENRARLSSVDLEYTILYQLADIYRLNILSSSNTLDYERILLEISARDAEFSSQDNFQRNLRRSIRQTLLTPAGRDENSLDRMVTLYRTPDSFSLRAHLLLGEFYVQSGRYNEALDHLINATLKMYTLLIDKIREIDPLFAFTSSEDFFRRIERNDQYLNYLKDNGFDRVLYFLAAAAFGFQAPEAVYREIWETVLILPFESEFTNRARAMINNPRSEEILFGSQQFRQEVNNR